jgi:hypothetical protein
LQGGKDKRFDFLGKRFLAPVSLSLNQLASNGFSKDRCKAFLVF